MQLVLILASTQVAMYAAVSFGFFSAVVDEDGFFNHTQSISLVYQHRDPYPLQLCTGLCSGAKR